MPQSQLEQHRHTSSTKDLTQGNLYANIITFAFPVFFSQVFQQLYNTADIFIVGKFMGTDALAAVASSGTLIFLMISFSTGTSMGAGVVISHYFGAGDHRQVSRSVHTVLAFGLVGGLILSLLGVGLTPIILTWMRTDPEVLPQAIEYFRFYFLGALVLVLYNFCCGIMNALGDNRRPLCYLIFSSLLNILLDWCFIGALHWGVWAAAVATILSQAASVFLCMIHLLQKGNIFTVELQKIRFHRDILLEIIHYGLPSGIQSSMIGLANVVVQSQINSFGKLAMAAYGAHSKIEGFAFLPITSFNMACTTFISQNLGAKQYDRAKKGAKFSVLATVFLAELIGIGYYTFSPQIIQLFDQNPSVVLLGVQQARTVAPFYFLLAFSHAIAAICRGAGRAVIPMSIMLAVWCGLRVVYIIFVMHVFGKIGLVYWAYPLTWSISSLIYLIYYLYSDWVHGFENSKL